MKIITKYQCNGCDSILDEIHEVTHCLTCKTEICVMCSSQYFDYCEKCFEKEDFIDEY